LCVYTGQVHLYPMRVMTSKGNQTGFCMGCCPDFNFSLGHLQRLGLIRIQWLLHWLVLSDHLKLSPLWWWIILARSFPWLVIGHWVSFQSCNSPYPSHGLQYIISLPGCRPVPLQLGQIIIYDTRICSQCLQNHLTRYCVTRCIYHSSCSYFRWWN